MSVLFFLLLLSLVSGGVVFWVFFQNTASFKKPAVMVGTFLLGVGLVYLSLGSPLLPSFTQSKRYAMPLESLPIEGLRARLTNNLHQNPSDFLGWYLLGDLLAQEGLVQEAADAYVQALTFWPEDTQEDRQSKANVLATYAHTLLQLSGGVITNEIDALALRLEALAPEHEMVRLLSSHATKQDSPPSP